MTTPIFDFIKAYAESKNTRFHMPGHKGVGKLGCEKYDITEIKGADVLYSAEGIIEESENNLSVLYGTCHSFYSTEGSTLAIKAMLTLVTSNRKTGERPVVLAGRNAHASFLRAAALLDIDVLWIYPEGQEHLCECKIGAGDIKKNIENLDRKPYAVYVTSPDYLGNMLDIGSLSRACAKYGVPLIVDNAHGAYLKFLPEDKHPITLGAAMCVDSAHKTLPVLTGGAYLHVSKGYPEYAERARGALSIFASTSPSYLTLASLDLCNERLDSDYPEKLAQTVKMVEEIKKKIANLGFEVCDSEPLKIVIKSDGSLAEHLRENGIEVEFSDRDFTVFMLTPDNSDADFLRLVDVISKTVPEKTNDEKYFVSNSHETKMTVREAVFSPCETVAIEASVGRICAAPTVSCPPAVPIVVSGEVITNDDVELFKRYGIDKVSVVIEDK